MERIMKRLAAAVGMAAMAVWAPGRADAATCESLQSLAVPHATIDSAGLITAASGFDPLAGRGGAAQREAFKKLPAFCRVTATLKPSNDSDIKVEVWLPVSNWNGKYQAVGNGGWTGSIAYPAMIEALGRGYATSSTDTGHVGGSASFALGHPEKLVDFGYRSVHEMASVSKAAINAFYSAAPRYSYFTGCSAGGRQGLQEAQRFPGDFDGIVAGAPASDWTGRAAQALRVWQAMHKSADSYIPPAKYPLIQKAALQACDALDGVRDGVLEDPTRCTFDPGVLACKGEDDSSCLTGAQVEAARQAYASPANPRTGRAIPGLQPGSEPGWATWGGPQAFATALDHFKYVVFKDPDWPISRFDFAAHVALAEQQDGNTINTLATNLAPFFERGGKLIQYHGWSDPQISPGSSVQYYQRVADAMGGAGRIDASYRLFMVPGMAHCGGGDGPNQFDMLSALEQWVERGQAPRQVIASRRADGAVVRTRPLCPYPQTAHYSGTGSTDEAANFVCR
jgi:feruloyl esterase